MHLNFRSAWLGHNTSVDGPDRNLLFRRYRPTICLQPNGRETLTITLRTHHTSKFKCMGGKKALTLQKGKPEYFNILPNSTPEPLIYEVASNVAREDV